jgi:hypothetical protein
MTKFLPPLKKKIRKLRSENYEIEEIFNIVLEEALEQVDSHEEAWKCVQANITSFNTRKYAPKQFDATKYLDDVQYLKSLKPKKFEEETIPFAKDILKKYENFDQISDANQQLNFNNPPFDFFGFKNGSPHIIEYKGRYKQFGAIRKGQRQRQHRILENVKSLKSALIQINFREQEYKILYDNQIDDCYPAKEIPMDSIINWIRSKL